HKIASDDGWTAGLLARVAVYRLDQYAILDRVLSSESVLLPFLIKARTQGVLEEGYDGKGEGLDGALLPENAPNRIEPIYYTRGGWPRSGPNRREDLAAVGPKWKKWPLICVKLCTRAIKEPEEADVLAIIRFPKNLPLCVVGPEPLNTRSLEK